MKYSKNSLSRFIPILLVIVITIVAVAAVIAIGRALLGGGGSTTSDTTAVTDEGRVALLTVDVSRAIQLTVRGPIVAEEKFRSYRVTISPESREITTYEGYLGNVLETKEFDNNTRAYEELVFALDKRRMMDGRPLTEEQNDLRGICASKQVYEFETLVNGETVRSLWTSDCEGSKGSALANVSEVINMFLNQIPDGRKIVSGVGLGREETFFRL
jgi:hypothetical protein